MADVSHLEKMGRELKCPICLSLFECAASITTCNHVFCNSCIVKSMKKESSCPVCNMPFHRREIRLSPHMDNLVGIYKSMETASGVHMFMSQSAPLTQLPEKLVEPCNPLQLDSQRSDGSHVQSSFSSSKKRVQVAHYPLPETPVHMKKLRTQVFEYMPEEDKNNTVSLNSKHTQRERSEPSLSPFFWLRDDEDAENLSQQSDGTPEAFATPPAALSFSDIMDSDDESPSKDNTQGEMLGKSPVVDLSDNEMLDWTQRLCSSQHCSMPMKSQIRAVQEEPLVVQDRSIFEPQPSTDADNLILGQGTNLTKFQKPDYNVNKKSKAGKPLERKKNSTTTRTTLKKTAVNVGTPLDVDGSSKKQDRTVKQNINFSNLEEKDTKRRTRSAKFESSADLAMGTIPSLPVKNPLNPTNEIEGKELPNLQEKVHSHIQCKTSKIVSRIKSKGISDSRSKSRKRRHQLSKILELKVLSENDDKELNVEASPASAVDNCFTLRKQRKVLLNEHSEAEKNGRLTEALPSSITNCFLNSKSKQLRPMKTESLKESSGHEIKRNDYDNFQALPEDSSVWSGSRQYDLNKRAPFKDLSEVESSPAILPNTMVDNHLLCVEKPGKCASELGSSKEVKSSKKFNVSSTGMSGNASGACVVPSSIMQTATIVQGKTGEVTNKSTRQEKTQSLVQVVPLRKCGSMLGKIQCAFCQSAENSKPYGKIIHYFDGRPVSADHREGSDLIHCHRICAECK
uniref:RING-type domain-containing protein n=1 Tax=Kalanchoe fedtschenkoi TaxID=63787 RepID=A0A7N0VLW1_KALFE